MDYSLRELECFTAVAEELSFTRGAKRLHLAQPPLSRHIRTLEEKIGARLFERRPRGVALTPAGRLFYEESRGILAQLARAGEAARRAGDGESERLRLGFVSAVLATEIVELLNRFRQAEPSVQVMLHDLPPAEQLRLISEGRLDGGFVGLEPGERPLGLRFVAWCRERLLLYVPSGHVLARAKRIRLGEVKSESFVAVSGEAAPAFSAMVRDLCREAGFRPRIVLESPRAQAVAVMVAAGSGVAILPESLKAFAGDSVSALPLKELPDITHTFALAAKKANGSLEKLLRMLKQTG